MQQLIRLKGIMRRELETSQLELSPYCMRQIEQLVGRGIKRMKMNNTLERPGYFMEAERNLVTLIRYFDEYSRNLGTFPQLGDSEFDAALRNCPALWPYSTSG
jgi:hypothetical protein